MEEHEKLVRMMQEREERDREGHIPPEHIVTGQCTFEALN